MTSSIFVNKSHMNVIDFIERSLIDFYDLICVFILLLPFSVSGHENMSGEDVNKLNALIINRR